MKLQLEPEARMVLERYGWSESRCVDVSRVIEEFVVASYEIEECMVKVLSSFSGFTVTPVVEKGVDFRNETLLLLTQLGSA